MTKRLQALGLVVLLLGGAVVAYGQDVSSALENVTGLTVQQQLYLTWATIACKYLAEFYSSVRNGGGLFYILKSFLYGENLPKPVAKDYTQELKDDKRIL